MSGCAVLKLAPIPAPSLLPKATRVTRSSSSQRQSARAIVFPDQMPPPPGSLPDTCPQVKNPLMSLRNFNSIACPSTQLESACLCVTSLLSWTSCGPSLVVSAEPPEPPWLLSLFRGVAALSSPASRLWRQPDYIPGTLRLQPSISVSPPPPLWLGVHRRDRHNKSHPQGPRPSFVGCMARRLYLGCLGLSSFHH